MRELKSFHAWLDSHKKPAASLLPFCCLRPATGLLASHTTSTYIEGPIKLPVSKAKEIPVGNRWDPLYPRFTLAARPFAPPFSRSVCLGTVTPFCFTVTRVCLGKCLPLCTARAESFNHPVTHVSFSTDSGWFHPSSRFSWWESKQNVCHLSMAGNAFAVRAILGLGFREARLCFSRR